MSGFIEACLKQSRTVLLLFSLLVGGGLIAYLTIPKESTPDIQVPWVHISLNHPGMSPQDATRLLLRPVEKQLQSIEGVKEITSVALEGGGYVAIEFYAGLNLNKALTDVRDKVNLAKKDFPTDTLEPIVEETNMSLFPVLVVQLSGDVPERILYSASKKIQDAIENVTSVLKVKLVGDRKEVIEITIDPLRLESYKIKPGDISRIFQQNNVMVPKGLITMGQGSFGLTTPGILQEINELMNLPIQSSNNAVIRLKDVAQVKRTFKDATSMARTRGNYSVALEVSKRIGENIIDTVEKVKETVNEKIGDLKGKINITFAQDTSDHIRNMLKELQNNILLALILVMIVIIASLGWRSALLIGLAVPVSFLSAIFFMHMAGMTLNVVVLFSLILSTGMLVDGAIIVVEYADRKMAEGYDKFQAYREGAIRMAWPVITSILTIIVVFMPLLFWPGITGQFMKYLPITLMATLSMSLLVALILVPVLGSQFAKLSEKNAHHQKELALMEAGPLEHVKGLSGYYIRYLNPLLNHPGKVIMGGIGVLISVIALYMVFGRGVEFFPNIEPESAAFLVHARGNHSLEEQNRIVSLVETKILKGPFFKTVSTQVGANLGENNDIIGKITVEFTDWQHRPKATEILKEYGKEVNQIPGISVEIEQPKGGPSQGKDIQLNITSQNYTLLSPELVRLKGYLKTISGLKDLSDTGPISGIEWEIQVDRAEASKYELSIIDISQAIQMLGSGLKVSTFQPLDSRDQLDIILRFPTTDRTLKHLEDLRLQTKKGSVPLKNFIKKIVKQKVNSIERIDGKPVFKVSSNVMPGVLSSDKVEEISAWLQVNPPAHGVEIKFQGEEADKKETGVFLMKAFGSAIFLILVILVTQFNSFFSAFLVLSAVIMSTVGVFIGLMIMDQPFGIVMTGIGIIALGGIIVSNNIIFIDTFDHLIAEYHKARGYGEKMSETPIISKSTINNEIFDDENPRDSMLQIQKLPLSVFREIILRTGALRLRPIILTKLTAILGLLPILARLDIDFMNFTVHHGAPSSEWWVQLATAIVFGLAFASLITLIITPCALMMRENYKSKKIIKTTNF